MSNVIDGYKDKCESDTYNKQFELAYNKDALSGYYTITLLEKDILPRVYSNSYTDISDISVEALKMSFTEGYDLICRLLKRHVKNYLIANYEIWIEEKDDAIEFIKALYKEINRRQNNG